MAAVISSNQLGLYNSSLNLLGTAGGESKLGRSGDQVYVNGVTGNLVIRHQDEYLAGLGLGMGGVRTYNSLGQCTDDNGDNWRLGLEQRLYGLTGTVNTVGSTVTRVAGDGAESLYTFDADRNSYISTDGDGAHDTLTFTEGTWSWTPGTRDREERYDADGRLVSVADADGHTTTYTYTGALLTRLEDASGQTLFFDYAGNNLTQIRTLSNGVEQTRVRYGYDARDRLTSVTVDLTPEDGSIADGNTYVTRYTYDGTSTRIASIVQGDGTSASFTYDPEGRIASVTDGEGRTTTLAYTVTAAGTSTDVTDPLGQVTTYEQDSEGRLVRVLAPVVNGARATTTYSYDAQGNLQRVEDAAGNAVDYTFDANGNLLARQDSAGNRVSYTYDAGNRVLTETSYLVADSDGSGPASASVPVTTRYAYDGEGHLRFTVSGEGRVTEYRYNAEGGRIASLAWTGARFDVSALAPDASIDLAVLAEWGAAQAPTGLQRTDHSYDFRGQLAVSRSYAAVDAAGAGVADGTEATTRFVYDQAGRLLQRIDPRGVAAAAEGDHTTSYLYDGLGRLLSTTDALGVTTLTRYDDAHNRVATTFANGLVQARIYDRAGQLIQQVEETAAGTRLSETRHYYDADGRLLLTQDPSGARTFLVYDAAGRPVGGIDATGHLTETVYDTAGRVERTVRYGRALAGATLASLLDANGQPLAADLSALRAEAAGSEDRATHFFYDRAGRLALTVDAEGYATQSFYDGLGRVTDEVRYATAVSLASIIDASVPNNVAMPDDRHTRRFYDYDGRLLATLDAGGYLTENVYDAAGQLVTRLAYATETGAALRATGTLADLRTSAGTSGDDQISRFFYNARGQLVGALDAEGYLTEYGYDLAGNRTEERRYYARANAFVEGLDLAALRPADLAARVTVSAYDENNRVTATTALPENTTTTFTYDGVGHLIATTRAANTAEVRTSRARYDVQGRVIAELNGEGCAQLDALGAEATPEQIDAVWSAYGVTHAHDAAGRRISTTDALDHTTYFYYDDAGRLRVTLDAEGNVSETRYNAFGEVSDTIRYAGTLSTAGRTGGLLGTRLTEELAALANAARDSHGRVNYTLRGAVREAIAAMGSPVASTTTYAYNAFGERETQTAWTDATLGLVTGYAYDRRGLLTATTEDMDGLARTTHRDYDAFGRVTTTVDGNGQTRSYGYDRLGRQVSVTDPLNATRATTYDAFGRTRTVEDALGHVTRYAYDDAARSFTITTPEEIVTTTTANRFGEIAIVIDGAESRTTYTYDRNGQLTDVTEAVGTVAEHASHSTYDNAGRRIETLDANGVVTRFEYDAANRLITRTVDPEGLALTTRTTYDGLGRILTTTDANGVVTTTEYDAKGQVTAVVVDPTGLALRTEYSYDALGHTLTVTEAAGTGSARTTEYVYDTLGRRIEEIRDPAGLHVATRYVYDANDNVVAKTEAAGTSKARTTRYVHDADNRLIYTLDALGGVTRTDYDAVGHVTGTVSFANAIGLTGLADAVTAGDIESRLAPDATRDRTTTTLHDDDGRAILTLDSLGYVKEWIYDGAGRIKDTYVYAQPVPLSGPATEGAVRAALTPDFDHDQHTQYTYDAAGRLIQTTDAEGFMESYTYDAAGNKVSFTNKLHNTWTYEYDAANRLVKETTPEVPVTRLSGSGAAIQSTTTNEAIVTVITHDGLGNVKTRTEAYGAPEARTTTYVYDNLGRQIQTIYPPVGVYDAAADAAANYQGRNETVQILTATTFYDEAGHACAARDMAGHFSYKLYDRLGRVTFEVDAERYVTHYTYDAQGNRATVTRYANALTETLFTANEEAATDTVVTVLTQAQVEAALVKDTAQDRTLTNEYDLNGRLTETRQTAVQSYNSDTHESYTASPTTRNSYNAFGQLIRQSTLVDNHDTWATTTFYYDRLGRKSAEVNALGYLTEYGYDAEGNLTRHVEYARALGAGTWDLVDHGTPAPGDETIGLDRETRYVYDRLNRKLAMSAVNVQYSSVDTNGAKPTVNTVTGTVTTKYEYDPVGNLVCTTNVDGGSTNTYYDALGRVAAATGTTRTGDGGGVGAIAPALRIAPFYLSATNILDNVYLTWSSLREWGDGEVRVTVYAGSGKHIKTFSGVAAMNGATVPDTGLEPGEITRIRVEKYVDGQWVELHNSTTDYYRRSVLTWEKAPVEGTQVVLRYRVAGSEGDWTTAIVETRGSRYWVDLNALHSDQYEYELFYTRSGAESPYAQGIGTFAVSSGAQESGQHVVGFVETPYMNAQMVKVWSTYNVALQWGSLVEWGSGRVRVVLHKGATSKSYTFDAVGAMDGVTIGNSGFVPGEITGIQVEKEVGEAWVTVHDTKTDYVGGERLVLSGNTSGLVGVDIEGMGFRDAIPIDGSVFKVDVSDLPRGSYRYTPVYAEGTTGSSLSGSFEVRGAGAGDAVQEAVFYCDVTHSTRTEDTDSGSRTYFDMSMAWGSLEGWGGGGVRVTLKSALSTKVYTFSALESMNGVTMSNTGIRSVDITSIKVEKYVGNVWVTLNSGTDTYERRLEISTVASDAATVSFQYRLAGSGGPFVSKYATNMGAGWWRVNYDDIANGMYEYALVVNGVAGATKTIAISRAGHILPASAPAELSIDSLGARYNAFGEITAKGLNDGWEEYFDYDQAGRLIRSNQTDGIDRTYAFNLQGLATAEIRGGASHVETRYDLLGRAEYHRQPSVTAVHAVDTIDAALTVDPFYMDVSHTTHTVDTGSGTRLVHDIALQWGSLQPWGDGDVRVVVKAGGTQRTYDFGGLAAMNGATLNDTGIASTYITTIQVLKQVNGEWVKLHDSADDYYNRAVLTWERAPAQNTNVTLKFRVIGSGEWVTVTPETRGSRYWVDLNALTPDQYEYVLAYAHGNGTEYARTTGTFAITSALASATPINSVHVVGFVETPYMNAQMVKVGVSYNVALQWGSLVEWGSGRVRVVLHKGATSKSYTFDAVGAMDGVTIRNSGFVPGEITGIQVEKEVGEAWVTVHDIKTDYVGGERLVLSGNTSGLVGIDIEGMGFREANCIDGSVFKVDVSDLPRGAYRYTPVYAEGTMTESSEPGLFNVRGVVTGPAVLERLSYYDVTVGLTELNLAWGSLEGWGGGNVRVTVIKGETQKTFTFSALASMQGVRIPNTDLGFTAVKVEKWVGGVWVELSCSKGDAYIQQLDISGVSADASTVTLLYRRAGFEGPYLSLDATRTGTGWWSVPYANMPNGRYECMLVVDGAVSVVKPLEITRGGRLTDVAAGPDSIAPVIEQTFDRWGNVIAVNDPRNGDWVTHYRYNQGNQLIEERKPEVQICDETGAVGVAPPTTSTFYDSMGRAVGVRDANGNVSFRDYDKAGQLVREVDGSGVKEEYRYDGLGRKIARIDGRGNMTNYQYDRNNRLIKDQLLLSSNTYQYDEAGNRIRVTNGEGESTDFFYDVRGNVVLTRLAGAEGDANSRYYTAAGYDALSRKTAEGNGNGDSQSWRYDYFGRLVDHQDLSGADYEYAYDASGRLIHQTNTHGQDLYYSYETSGALRSIIDFALQTETRYAYDAAGNRVGERCTVLSTGERRVDDRLEYDTQGRLTAVRGVRHEVLFSYDANGNRRHTSSTAWDASGVKHTQDYWYRYDGANRITLSQGVLDDDGHTIKITEEQGTELYYDAAGNRAMAVSFDGSTRVEESYTYDENNRLETTHRDGKMTSERAYDKAGRQVLYKTFTRSGETRERRITAYDDNGWVLFQKNYDDADELTHIISYDYEDAYDAVGNVRKYSVKVVTGAQYTNTFTKDYAKYDAYKEQVVRGTSTYFDPGNTTSTYDVNGNLVKVVDKFGTDKTRSFVTNSSGQILKKVEGDDTQFYFYANGRPIGSIGGLGNKAKADFDFNYTPVSDQYPSSSPSSYVVNDGDTLDAIALAVFGDSRLWYLIADANGVTSDAELQVGQTLRVPSTISNIHNNSTTFKPYNPGEIIGDTTPTLPQPPQPACDVVASIVVVAITAAMTSIAGPIMGNVVGQMAGVALGTQKDFSWESFGAAVILAGLGDQIRDLGGAINRAIPDVVEHAKTGAEAVMTIGERIANTVVSQGVGLLTGSQKQFSWGAMAAAAIGGSGGKTFDDMMMDGVISGAVSGAVHALASGGHIEWGEVAVDAFGNALGNSVGNRIAAATRNTPPLTDAQKRAQELGYGPVTDEAARELLSGRTSREFGVGVCDDPVSRKLAERERLARDWEAWGKDIGSGPSDTKASSPTFAAGPAKPTGGFNMNPGSGRLGTDVRGGWVASKDSIVPRSSAPSVDYNDAQAAALNLPPIDRSFETTPGAMSALRTMLLSVALDPSESWLTRGASGAFAAILTNPASVDQDMVRPILNDLSVGGQYFARASLQTDPDAAALDRLHAIKALSMGVFGLGTTLEVGALATAGRRVAATAAEGDIVGGAGRGVVPDTREWVLANIAESRAAREASNFGGGLRTDALQVPDHTFRTVLENRGLPPGAIQEMRQSFDGPVFARHGFEGDQFIITESTPGSASGVYVTRESAGATPDIRRQVLALPPRNTALVESPVSLARPQVLFEGTVAPQPTFGSYATGGGWQVITDGGFRNNALIRW